MWSWSNSNLPQQFTFVCKQNIFFVVKTCFIIGETAYGTLSFLWNGKLGGPLSQSGCYAEDTISCPFWELNLDSTVAAESYLTARLLVFRPSDKKSKQVEPSITTTLSRVWLCELLIIFKPHEQFTFVCKQNIFFCKNVFYHWGNST
jgi:hypothetical protein